MASKTGRRGAVGQWITLGVYVLVGAAAGGVILGHMEGLQEASPQQMILRGLLLFVWLYLALYLQLVLHEAGHLVAGLLTGYRFSSFRVGSLMWIRQEGRVRLKRYSLAGTGGQCLMSPPDLRDGKMPVMLYNFGGALMNLLTALLAFLGGLACPVGSFGQAMLWIFALVGVALGLLNGLPMTVGGVNNDGRNALELCRDPSAIRSFWVQMKVAERMAQGERLREMPADWFQMPTAKEMRNGIHATVGVFCCGRLLDEGRFEEADAEMARLMAMDTAMVGLHRVQLCNDRLYLEAIGPNRPEALAALRTPAQLKMMKAMGKDPGFMRTEYAYALLAEKDPAKADKVRQKFERIAKNYPYPQEIEAERERMAICEGRRG